MDPATFGRVGNMSAVVRQPDTVHAREEAMKALVTCPTYVTPEQTHAPAIHLLHIEILVQKCTLDPA